MDAIEQLTKELKAPRKKVKAMEEAGGDTQAMADRIEKLETRLAKVDPDFGDWD